MKIINREKRIKEIFNYVFSGCVDTDQRCPTWKNYCKSNSYVVEKCKRTCRNCPVLQGMQGDAVF